MKDDHGVELLLRKRLTAQMLAGTKARDPVAVVERLLAVQGQDPRGARLAIRSRSKGLTAASVDDALSVDRTLLITWLNRGTLHLVRSEDYPWLHALTTPPLVTGNARRLAQEGVTPVLAEKGVRTIKRALASGPLTRLQLRDRLASAGIPTEGQALVHTLMLATLRGDVIRGPMKGKQHAYVLTADWLPPAKPVDREIALGELARRYLIGHAPASDRDLAKWAGLPLGDARRGLKKAAATTTERPDGLLDLRNGRRTAPTPPPALLGSFDPVLLGWESREPVLGSARGLITVNGLFRPFAIANGKACARWSLSDGRLEVEPLRKLTRKETTALDAESKDVLRFLGIESEG